MECADVRVYKYVSVYVYLYVCVCRWGWGYVSVCVAVDSGWGSRLMFRVGMVVEWFDF